LAADYTPKPPDQADKLAGGRIWPVCTALPLSNSGCQICDVVQEKPPRDGCRVLKNGAADPIQTLNVVTGPPEVGEVNTSSRAYEGPVD
jgi:hypothetical protein